MAYADYAFYRDTYSGDLIKDEIIFVRLALRASEWLDHVTFHRISQPDDDVRLAVCAMAEVLFWEEKRKSKYDGREVQREDNDGYSVTFASTDQGISGGLTQTEKDLYLAAYKYLSQTGIMDFGVET